MISQLITSPHMKIINTIAANTYLFHQTLKTHLKAKANTLSIKIKTNTLLWLNIILKHSLYPINSSSGEAEIFQKI